MDKILGKVPMGEKIGYSLGDAAANLVFQMMMIYQLKFYTDVFGLEGAIAGTVLLIARDSGCFCRPGCRYLVGQDTNEVGEVPALGHLDSSPVHGLLCVGFLQSGDRE